MDTDAVIDISEGRILIKRGALVEIDCRIRKAVGCQGQRHLVLYEKAPGTDGFDDSARDYPGDLRAALIRSGVADEKVIAERVEKVGKSGFANMPRRPRAAVTDDVNVQ